MNNNSKIYVSGHQGLVGSSIVRNLKAKGCSNIVTRSRNELELTDQKVVQNFFEIEKPDEVYMAAAKVGGIHANNTYPADFIYDNLMVELNVIHSAFLNGVKKLLFLGSSCIYPKFASQPMKEELLLTGKLELTNEPYAIAKISGIKLCESYNRQYGYSHGLDYRSIMPTNLYGPGDKYFSEDSHVIPALLSRFHNAKVMDLKKVSIWGSGEAKREFLFVDDMASASIFVMKLEKDIYDKNTHPMQQHINVGFGQDISIKELAFMIRDVVGYKGDIEFDTTKPDGPPRKLMDSSLINRLGWYPKTSFEKGLRISYEAMQNSAGIMN